MVKEEAGTDHGRGKGPHRLSVGQVAGPSGTAAPPPRPPAMPEPLALKRSNPSPSSPAPAAASSSSSSSSLNSRKERQRGAFATKAAGPEERRAQMAGASDLKMQSSSETPPKSP